MKVCEYCGEEDISYTDRDDTEHYCEDCFKKLGKDYVKFNGIRRI